MSYKERQEKRNRMFSLTRYLQAQALRKAQKKVERHEKKHQHEGDNHTH